MRHTRVNVRFHLKHTEALSCSLIVMVLVCAGCVHELSIAKASGIPIICVIDQDRFQQVSEVLCLIEAI
jgi:hypothetical protein